MSTEAESQDIPNSTPINDGMECDTKEIYEVKRDRMGNITWSAKYPDDVEDAAENQEIASYAILVLQQKLIFSQENWNGEYYYPEPIAQESWTKSWRIIRV